MCSNKSILESGMMPNKNLIELAKLDLLIREAMLKNDKITISTTIKNINKRVEVKNIENLEYISYFISSLLYCSQRGLYEIIYDWKSKKSLFENLNNLPNIFSEYINLIADNKGHIKKLFAGYTEPYSVKELEMIIGFENEKDIEFKKESKKILNRNLKYYIEKLRNENKFNNSYKTISTDEACLLYDLLVAAERVPKGISLTMNNQEKYQYIKRKLK